MSQSSTSQTDTDTATDIDPAVADPGFDLTRVSAGKGFLPYPAELSGPSIVPNDLSGFRARGVSKVEKELRQQLVELRERYVRVIDEFNWNKLIYESEFAFEPVMGEIYHLYRRTGGGYQLMLVAPGEWHRPWLGSFRLNIDGRWEVVDSAADFNPVDELAGTDPSL